MSYYQHMKGKPCAVCGSDKHVELDHVKPYSSKTGSLGPRSHDGLAAFYCIPLCRACHANRHKQAEDAYYSTGVYLSILKNMIEYFHADERQQRIASARAVHNFLVEVLNGNDRDDLLD